MDSQDTTPEFTNYDEDTGRINLDLFRKHYKIPAADIRAICKELNLDIVRDGADQFIIGNNPYNVSNSYYLKHAVYEYRRTMYVNKTKAGDFQEYEIDLEGKGTLQYGVHNIEEEDVKPKTPSIKTKPNKTSPTLLVPRSDVDRGKELMLRRAPVPAAPAAPVAAPSGVDALQLLVSALSAAAQAPAPVSTLNPQRTLLEAEENGFLITTEQLGQVLGMSKTTISSKKTGFRKLGFVFEKVKEGNTTLWKAKRY